MEAELKPCPFCGDEAPRHLQRKGYGSRGTDYEIEYAIECEICGCRTKWFSRLLFAIRAWNRRAEE